MRVLVTGASGFVGQAVVAELLNRGHQVVAVYGPVSAFPTGTSNRIEYASADVGEPGSLRALTAFGSVDAVIHAAGIAHRFGKTDDSEYQRVNIDGVRNVAEVAAHLAAQRFVLISSVLVYGRNDRVDGRPVTEEDRCHPADVYAKSKLEGELAALEVCRSHEIPLSILRPAPIIGEGSKGNFSRLIEALHRGRFVWVGNGSNRKSLIYVGDVARTAVHLVERSNEDYEIYNVAAESIAMRDVVNSISLRLGKTPPRIVVPPFPILQSLRLARLTPLKNSATRFLATLQTWLADDIYSCERLANKHKLETSVSIDEAINREVRYYLNNR
jgi:nucleoside-diphosphate-sugar epimerase